jgi:hypothetical protein
VIVTTTGRVTTMNKVQKELEDDLDVQVKQSYTYRAQPTSLQAKIN